MSAQEETKNFFKTIRTNHKKSIHKLLIFNKTGSCLYVRNLTAEYKMEENLLCSFFFAIMSFSKEIVGDKVKTIEMGGVKFVIIEKELFYFGILCKSMENIAFLEDIICKINSRFITYINENKINIGHEYIIDDDLNELIDSVILGTLTEYDLEKEEVIINFLKKLTEGDDFEGIILLTDTGKVIYSSLNKLYLRTFLKEVDFRVKICNNSILKLFYTSKNNHLIFSEYVDDLYFIILVFNLKTKFGIAEYYLHKIVKNIRKILNS
ncbi:MAG: hypothetical protein ACTSR8_00635 [Promethearchaeota archaeon]